LSASYALERRHTRRFPFDRLIRFYPFEDINEALSDGEHGRTVKPYCGSAQFDAFRQMSASNSIAAGADALVIVTECLFLLRLIERPTAWLGRQIRTSAFHALYR
jgi:hypothetical protein